MTKAPPGRYLDAATATEFDTDPISGKRRPLNDGKDDPAWLYENVYGVDGSVRRVPIRIKAHD